MNPDSIYGGLSAVRKYTLPHYPASAGWALKARILGATSPVEIPAPDATCAGIEWTLIIPASATAQLATGRHTLVIIAFNASFEHLVAKEFVQVFAAAETDLRSQDRRTLDALNDVIEGKAGKDHSSISINGRSISRMTWPELLAARDSLTRRVAVQEAREAGRGRIRTVNMRFVND